MMHRYLSVMSLIGILLAASSCDDNTVSRLTWEKPGADAPLGLMEAQGLALNGKLYVFGGFYNEPLDATLQSKVYDPATNTWTSLAPLPEDVTHAGQATDGKFIYLVGGFVGKYPGTSTDKFWKYDVTNNLWSEGPLLPDKRGAGALVFLERALHYFGGVMKNADGAYEKDYGDHWVLQLDNPNPTWKSAAPLPNPRNHMGGATAGGKIYAVGGQHLWDQLSGNQSSVHVYNPAIDTWKEVAPLPVPKGHVTANVLERNGRVIVISGIANGDGSRCPGCGEVVATIEEYDPATDTWTVLTPLPKPRQSPVSGIIGDQLIVAGGSVKATTWIGKLSPSSHP